SDHSDGIRYLDGKADANGALKITDYKRSRVTGGITLSFAKPFVSDIRINYEKYFYAKGSIPKVSERDKIVIEVMTHF
ncbi:MAG: porin, partial [Prevotella sp.]|nr:porin [Prevotella sp.]